MTPIDFIYDVQTLSRVNVIEICFEANSVATQEQVDDLIDTVLKDMGWDKCGENIEPFQKVSKLMDF